MSAARPRTRKRQALCFLGSGKENRGQVFLCAQLLSFTKIKRRYFQNVKPDPNPL